MSSPAERSRLAGRTAVVTGGGRGIGAAVCRALAEAGAAVVASARSTDEIEAIAGAIRRAGHRAWAVPCDVTDPVAVGALHAAARGVNGQAVVLDGGALQS